MKGVSLKDLSLSPEESKEIVELLARIRGIKNYKSMSKCSFSSISIRKDKKPKISKARIGEIEREFNELRHKFSNPKIKEIRKKNIYEIKSRKNRFRTKRYHDYDDAEYKGITDIESLFDLSIGEDYYKPIIVNTAFNNNYIEYESREDKDKILTISEYLDMIGPYLVDMINDYKAKSEWKIQLTMVINFISSKPGSDETPIMYTKGINIEIMIGSDTNEVSGELFKSLLQKYQENLEEKMSGSEFVFDGVNALYYDKTSLVRGKSYIDSPEWLKNKKAKINPKNKDVKCFHYVLTAGLNYQIIKKILKEYQKLSLLLISIIGMR